VGGLLIMVPCNATRRPSDCASIHDELVPRMETRTENKCGILEKSMVVGEVQWLEVPSVMLFPASQIVGLLARTRASFLILGQEKFLPLEKYKGTHRSVNLAWCWHMERRVGRVGKWTGQLHGV